MDKLIAWLDAKRGRRKLLAEELGISSAALSQWKNVPPHHVLDVARLTRIKPADLNPSVFAKRELVGQTENAA